MQNLKHILEDQSFNTQNLCDVYIPALVEVDVALYALAVVDRA